MGITNEYGSACVMIDSGVTLDIYGTPAFAIAETAMKDAIYCKSPVKLQEGTINILSSRDPEEHPDEDYQDPVSYYTEIVDEEGNPYYVCTTYTYSGDRSFRKMIEYRL